MRVKISCFSFCNWIFLLLQKLKTDRISLNFVVSVLTSILSLSLIYFFFLFFQTCQVKLLVQKELWCPWLLPLLLSPLLLLSSSFLIFMRQQVTWFYFVFGFVSLPNPPFKLSPPTWMYLHYFSLIFFFNFQLSHFTFYLIEFFNWSVQSILIIYWILYKLIGNVFVL